MRRRLSSQAAFRRRDLVRLSSLRSHHYHQREHEFAEVGIDRRFAVALAIRQSHHGEASIDQTDEQAHLLGEGVSAESVQRLDQQKGATDASPGRKTQIEDTITMLAGQKKALYQRYSATKGTP